MKNQFFFIVVAVLFLQACTVIRPGQIGLKQSLGKIKTKAYVQGVYFFNPFISKFIKVDIKTTNLTNALENLPTKEGLTISAELAVLYHIKPESASNIITTIGLKYEETILLSVLRSAAADIQCDRTIEAGYQFAFSSPKTFLHRFFHPLFLASIPTRSFLPPWPYMNAHRP